MVWYTSILSQAIPYQRPLFFVLSFHMYANCVTFGNLSLLTNSPHDSYVNSGVPTATTLVYNESTRSLTCTSTGGPATTVTWRKDGAVITLNATYQQTQMVTDPVTGTYQIVLSIDIVGTYSCIVGNTRGTSAAIETTGKDLFTVSAGIVTVIL